MKHLVIAFSLFLGTAASAHVTPAQFQQWMKDGARQPASVVQTMLSTDGQQHARQARYVFVTGYFADVTRSGFADVMQMMQDLGVPRSHLYRLMPSSSHDMDQNLAYLKHELTPILSDSDDPIVLIGHSRGAVEALAYALSAPREIRDRIHALYLIHGAFGGSPIADFVAGEPMPMDDRLPAPVRYVMSKITGADLAHRLTSLEKLTGFPIGEGLLSLTHKAQTEFWTRLVQQNRAASDELNNRIYYIRGYESSSAMKWGFKIPGYYMDIYYGANDGVVPFAYQSVDGLGTPLVVLEEDHNGLTGGTYVAHRLKMQRHAFTDAVYVATGME